MKAMMFMPNETVILTTLSTLFNRKMYSYYYVEEGEKRLYCDGLLSVEAGTKYYLSQNKVDRIVAIASRETRQTNVRNRMIETDKRLYEGRSLAKGSSFKRNATDADLFFERVSSYWNGFRNKDLATEIEPVRRRELQSIVRKVLRNKGESCPKDRWFDVIGRNGYNRDVEKAVRENIEASFLTEADYRRYSDDAWKAAELDFQKKMSQRLSVDDFFLWLEASGKKLSWLGREAFCRLYQTRLNQWLREADYHSAEAANAMRDRASQYRDAIQRLTEELNTLKTNRLRRELSYLQRKLFLDLAPELRLSPKKDEQAAAPEITVVPDGDIYEIIRHIRGKSKSGLRLLIDVQGGNRTSSYEMNSLLSILKNTESIECTYTAVNFNVRNYVNEIRDETNRYRIADLVAAMNAFVAYGRAKQLRSFCEESAAGEVSIVREDSAVGTLLQYMTSLEDGLALCNAFAIRDNLKEIMHFFAERRNKNEEFKNAYIRTLQDSIEKDYASIEMNGDNIDLQSMIDWALRKEYYQQAITLAEDLIPGEIVRSGILCYALTEAQRDEAKAWFQNKYQQAAPRDLWKFQDPDYYFVKFECSIKGIQNAQFVNNGANQSGLSLRTQATRIGFKWDIIGVKQRYNNICNLRNSIAHAAANAAITGEKVKQTIQNFWEQYNLCKNQLEPNRKEVLRLTFDDIS